MPLVARVLTEVRKHTYKGPVIHNTIFQDLILTLKGTKDITDLALTTMNNWLDDTDLLWKVLQAYPECAATEGQRWMELLHQMKKWSENDRNKFPTDIFIHETRTKSQSTGVKSLSDLVSSFSSWFESRK